MLSANSGSSFWKKRSDPPRIASETNARIEEPAEGEAALAGDGGRDPFQDGSHRVEQKQALPLSKQGRIEEDRCEEDGKGQKHLDQVLDVAEEKTGRGEENSQSDRQHDQQADQNGQPQQAPSQRNAQEDQHDRQYEAGDEKIHELGKDRTQGKDHFREVNLGDEVRVCDQAVGPESDRGNEESPGNRPDGYVHQVLARDWLAGDLGKDDPHDDAGQHDRRRHEDGPQHSEDGLLVFDADITPRHHVEQGAEAHNLTNRFQGTIPPGFTSRRASSPWRRDGTQRIRRNHTQAIRPTIAR